MGDEPKVPKKDQVKTSAAATAEAAEEIEDAMTNAEPDRKPALVVNFYSWATPIVGAVALIAGLLLGYFGRPLISKESSPSSASVPSSQVSSGTTADQQELMTFLLGEMRHFRGDPDAPVTLIEFSDFL